MGLENGTEHGRHVRQEAGCRDLHRVQVLARHWQDTCYLSASMPALRKHSTARHGVYPDCRSLAAAQAHFNRRVPIRVFQRAPKALASDASQTTVTRSGPGEKSHHNIWIKISIGLAAVATATRLPSRSRLQISTACCSELDSLSLLFTRLCLAAASIIRLS